MGANSSAPKTAEFTNPHMEAVFTITPPVSHRIENIRRQELGLTETTHMQPSSYVCSKCEKEKQIENNTATTSALSAYQKKLIEIENYNFEEKFNELQNCVPNRQKWSEETKQEFKAKESDLVKCLKEYPGEPLQCYKNAKEYHNFVFDKQLKSILKNIEAGGDNANQQLKTPKETEENEKSVS